MNKTIAIRLGGIALTVGSVTWAVARILAPPVDGIAPTAEILGGFAYQLGLAGYLTAAWLTGALGNSRGARISFRVEAALLVLASLWSVVYAIDPGTQQHWPMIVLDPTWPLSMLGLIVVGFYIFRARIWSALARQLALIASLWLPLEIFASVIGGDSAGVALVLTWLVVVWGGLGVIISTRLAGDPQHGQAAPSVRPEQPSCA